MIDQKHEYYEAEQAQYPGHAGKESRNRIDPCFLSDSQKQRVDER